jgi:hypothetical protein
LVKAAWLAQKEATNFLLLKGLCFKLSQERKADRDLTSNLKKENPKDLFSQQLWGLSY